MNDSDRELGMDRAITRRDFLDGASAAIGAGIAATALPVRAAAAFRVPPMQQGSPDYPPSLTALRGQNESALKYAHALRDGAGVTTPESTDETYDLVVVGAGLSGLGAAYYYRKERPGAKILLLDNHDDFGGHARRNEFTVDGRQVIAFGGTMRLSDIPTYTAEGLQLLQDIGIDRERFEADAKVNSVPYPAMGMRSSCFFDRENYGKDALVLGMPGFAFTPTADSPGGWAEFLSKAPLSNAVKEGLLRLDKEAKDYMPGLSRSEKLARLQKMTYEDYLLKVMGIHPDIIKFIYNSDFHSINGAAGPDSYSAAMAWQLGKGGFQGMGLGDAPPNRPVQEPAYDLHLPDGNGGVARLMVRWLIPEALPGSTMQDAYATGVNYAALDRPQNSVRLRLGSTVLNVKHDGTPDSAKDVQVTYIRGGKTCAVKANAVVLACFNAMVPHICPDLPQPQKEALHMSVRMPLNYTSVALRNWRAHAKLGIANTYFPSGLYSHAGLDHATGVGPYKRAQTPDEPTFLNMWMWPLKPGTGLPAREQFRLGRALMLQIPFEEYERSIRSQLARALGPGGFDPARDIAAITVNRWGHGYAGTNNPLFDPQWSREELPWVVGRKRFGRIAIANSDAGAACLTSCAFEQAHRAVTELVTDVQPRIFNYRWGPRLS